MNYPSQNESRRIWKLLFLQIIVLLVSTLVSAGQDASVADSEKQSLINDKDLDSMSDQELEAICTTRGFELYREMDEATGEEYVFSHADYVEAARQCLAVEREMGELLAEHPELVEELQSEVDTMKAEKERLEKEIADAEKKRADNATESHPARAFVSQEASETETDDAKDGASEGGSAFGLAEGDAGKEEAVVGEKNETESAAAEPEIETNPPKTDAATSATESVVEPKEPVDSTEATAEATEDRASTESIGSVDNEEAMPTQNASSTTGASEEESSKALSDTPKEDLPFLEEFLAEIKKDLGVRGENIQKLFTKVADIVVPKPLRGPLKIVLGKSLHIAKDTSIGAMKLLNRYLRAFLQNARRKVDAAQSKKREEANKQKPAAAEGAAVQASS